MKIIAFMLAAACLCLTGQAQAAKAVFDSKNFAKNAQSAAEAARQTKLMADELATQTRQYMLQVRDLKQISQGVIERGISRGFLRPDAAGLGTPGEVLKSAGGVYANYQDTMREMDAMEQSYRELDGLWREVERISSGAQMSPEKIMEVEGRAAALGRKQAADELNRLQESLGQLERHQQRADYLASQLPKAGGTVELLQTLGVQNHLVSDQMSQLIQVGVSSAQAAQQEALLRARERERSAEVERQATERNRKIYDAPQ